MSEMSFLYFLQALSKRIHYGKFVAEAKYLASPDVYRAAIEAQVLPYPICIPVQVHCCFYLYAHSHLLACNGTWFFRTGPNLWPR